MANRGPELASITIVFLVSSWLFVGLRIFTRTKLIKSIGADDWLIVLTLILFSCYSSIGLYGISHGTGKPAADLTPQESVTTAKVWLLDELFYAMTTCALKLSIGCFFLRVTRKKIHIYPIWGVMALSLIYGTYMFFFVIFQCRPTSYFWDKAQNGHCVSADLARNSTYGHASINALADWTFGFLPAFIVYGLQMNRRTKISVYLLLCAANVGSVATLARIAYIHQLSTNQDIVYATFGIEVWSTVEPGVGIAAASIATLRPLFHSFYSKIDSTRSRSRSRTSLPLSTVGRHQRLELSETSPVRASPKPMPSILGGSSPGTDVPSSPGKSLSSWIHRGIHGARKPKGEIEVTSEIEVISEGASYMEV